MLLDQAEISDMCRLIKPLSLSPSQDPKLLLLSDLLHNILLLVTILILTFLPVAMLVLILPIRSIIPLSQTWTSTLSILMDSVMSIGALLKAMTLHMFPITVTELIQLTSTLLDVTIRMPTPSQSSLLLPTYQSSLPMILYSIYK